MGLTIDRDRLWSDLMEVGQIGFAEGKGVTRSALSDADIKAKDWLVEKRYWNCISSRETVWRPVGFRSGPSPVSWGFTVIL